MTPGWRPVRERVERVARQQLKKRPRRLAKKIAVLEKLVALLETMANEGVRQSEDVDWLRSLISDVKNALALATASAIDSAWSHLEATLVGPGKRSRGSFWK